MIDRIALNRLYNDQEGKKLVEMFYQLLCFYTKDEKLGPVEECLFQMNQRAKSIKQRLVYYDNHCLKEDLSQFIVEEYRLSRNLKQK